MVGVNNEVCKLLKLAGIVVTALGVVIALAQLDNNCPC
jgi:hypothetical protein